MKKLYKSRTSAPLSGILGGLGEWMEVSPGILRVGYIALIILTGIIPGIALYLVLHFIIPKSHY